MRLTISYSAVMIQFESRILRHSLQIINLLKYEYFHWFSSVCVLRKDMGPEDISNFFKDPQLERA